MADRFNNLPEQYETDGSIATLQEKMQMYDIFINGDDNKIIKGKPIESIIDMCRQPPETKPMENIRTKNCIFMISPFRYDSSYHKREPTAIYHQKGYIDRWDGDHVRMPCSPSYVSCNRQPMWLTIQKSLTRLKQMCDCHTATIKELKETIEQCAGYQFEMSCLEKLINDTYTDEERSSFMFTTLSKICSLALTVDKPPPLLRIKSDRSVTMSQRQAASLLACAFFCLFPFRSDHKRKGEYEKFPNPNFNKLYKSGTEEKIEKLKCIFHYFQRVTENMPVGVITFRRCGLRHHLHPNWTISKADLCDMHLTTSKKIEDVSCVLQVDFANKYIGGGVLTSGCVQEEIRFTVCSEMLVSLLVCEMMEPYECIYLIGCERYSTYRGYSDSFKYAGDYCDVTSKDTWGRKWCHLVAMDAIFFQDPSTQYQMKLVDRELTKAYTSFRPLGEGRKYAFGIVTGNWGCGAFNGDRQLKAIIQLITASEAQRPLIYAAYRDRNFVNLFFAVYEYLLNEGAKVGDLYQYLQRYSTRHDRSKLFEYILKTPVSSLKS